MTLELTETELTLKGKLWGKPYLRLYTLLDLITAMLSVITIIYSAYNLTTSDNAGESLVIYGLLLGFGILALIAFILSLIILFIPSIVIGTINVGLIIVLMIAAIVLGSLVMAQIGELLLGVIMVSLGIIAFILLGMVLVAVNAPQDNPLG